MEVESNTTQPCAVPLPLPEQAVAAYRRAGGALREAGVPWLAGGAYALAYYTGVVRHTKDFDIFIRPTDRDRALSALAAKGFRTGIEFPFWLAKAFEGEHMVDLIYRAPNGLVEVTDHWFTRGKDCELLGMPARLCTPEEMLITKLFVLNNDRNDLADVMHLFLSCAERMDWDHLIEQLGPHWRVLLAHLVLFGYVYPSERTRVPDAVMHRLIARMEEELRVPTAADRVCFGGLFSHSQYKIDLESGGFEDGRLQPHGRMTPMDLFDSLISVDDPHRPESLRAARRNNGQ